MPDLDGLEATRRILSARPAARVLVLTGHDDEQMRDAARAAGARAFVVKSAPTQELTDTVRALARGESPLGARTADARRAAGTATPLARMPLHDPPPRPGADPAGDGGAADVRQRPVDRRGGPRR